MKNSTSSQTDIYTNPLTSKKSGSLHGTLRVPGDKSMSHRALMFGALAEDETMISGLLEGEDVYNTAAAMRAMGARIIKGEDGLWRCFGQGIGNLTEPSDVLNMGNSGTSTRLLMGIVAAHPITACFTGDKSLVNRPMGRVITPLEQMGATFLSRAGGRLPLAIKGTEDAKAITYKLPVASAQVKSAILLAGLNARGTTTVIEDHPTRDHSENMLRHFGIQVTVEKTDANADAISITGGQRLLGCAIDVPADPSSAGFPVVAALINEGSDIHLPRVGINPRRIGLYETLIEMGADIVFDKKKIEAGEPIATISVKSTGSLKGITVPPERVPSMIDEFPILAMAAACANGTTYMTGLAELRVKESDRLLMVAQGLKACGVNLEMGNDWLTIHGTGKPPQGGATIETALDHRIAMSFLVLGTATEEPITIDDGSPIKTSFPNFIELMTEMGACFDFSN
ncbi:MAG: 3-phosphoshikimate 1-carboxyvinyltransferase [Alphaproteobacteria bacterium]|nr:3-phosphoshikimate 1-carboxyvinyltransferase [Alphaproteobacteria bacterium]MCB9985513.1 3-phosphoshikimate 1-carboxyvinyltransferase [Micavibrio sp.]HPQ50656.1 3-phosphoshikimate 1-carboxyvinyltransferase [Alphaproteobacteria bacterium]